MARVLIVEDNSVLLDSMAFNLEMRGYETIQAMDGQEALNVMRTLDTPPDIVVSDIAMPNLNGYQLLEAIHSETRWGQVPVIFLTAFDSQNAIRLGKEMGVDDYLVKPFDPEELVLTIENKLKTVSRFRENAERKFKDMRNELLHLISHELRTPLTAIYGGIEVLATRQDQLSEEATHEIIGIVRGGAKRMNRMIEQVVFLMQVDSGTAADWVARKSHPLELDEIIQTAYEICRYEQVQAGIDRNINVMIRTPGTTPVVNGYRDFLINAVTEIIRNAYAYSPNNGDINITYDSAGTMAFISIEDEGPGVSAEDLPHVWERFTRFAHENQDHPGAGLGLAIAKECANLHHGKCMAERLERGFRVTLLLPLARD